MVRGCARWHPIADRLSRSCRCRRWQASYSVEEPCCSASSSTGFGAARRCLRSVRTGTAAVLWTARALCFGERYECTRIRCHMPVALSQALCRYETRCGFLPHLEHCSTLIVHGCPASGSSSSLQIGGRLAQSAYVAPTTKGAERAATVSKCVVNNGFDCDNDG